MACHVCVVELAKPGEIWPKRRAPVPKNGSFGPFWAACAPNSPTNLVPLQTSNILEVVSVVVSPVQWALGMDPAPGVTRANFGLCCFGTLEVVLDLGPMANLVHFAPVGC